MIFSFQELVTRENELLLKNSTPVDSHVIEQYRKDLAEDFEKFIVEDKLRRQKTAELSQRIFII